MAGGPPRRPRLRRCRCNSVWEDLREFLLRLWRGARQSAKARRVDSERARFWAEVREGEREAEARSGQ
jgi:hypothetical protein